MGKRVMMFIVAMVLAAGCAKQGADIVVIKDPEIKRAEVTKVVEADEDMNLMAFMDFHKDRFIVALVEPSREKGVIQLRDKDLRLIREIEVSRGKGPGEFLFPANLQLSDEYIYMLDGAKNSVELFDLEGNYTDSWIIKSSVGIFKSVTSLVVNGTDFYIAPLIPYIAAKFNASGDVSASVKSHLENNDDGRMWQAHASRLAMDKEGNIYLSYNETDYRICKYDKDFNLIWDKQIEDKSNDLKDGMEMVPIADAKQPVGVFTHSTFAWKDDKLFVFRGVGGELCLEMREGEKRIGRGPIKNLKHPYIDVFSDKDCSFLYRIEVPFVKTDSWSEVSVMDDGLIFLVTMGASESEYENSIVKTEIR